MKSSTVCAARWPWFLERLCFCTAVQDIRVGGRVSNSQYQYTLQSDSLNALNEWAPKLVDKLKTIPMLLDVNSDQQVRGLQTTSPSIATRRAPGREPANDRYDALQRVWPAPGFHDVYGHQSVSRGARGAAGVSAKSNIVDDLYVKTSNGNTVPISTFTHFRTMLTSLTVNHQGQFPAITLSFALAPGVALSQAVDAVQNAEEEIGMPGNVRGGFAGTAQVFQTSMASEPLFILAALLAVYIVLGMLYESYIHPITILSTLPSAGVGAIVALMFFHTEMSVIALIGIILLIGIVKKNAIMMIDFALQTERQNGLSPRDAIYQACLLRFRPIIMTTMAALFGGLPLAIGTGMGSELRRPLGITIVGGLILSQLLTLYTTPVVYLYLDRLQSWFGRQRHPRLQSYLADNPMGD